MIARHFMDADIHRHNWVTHLLGKFFLRSKERRVSYMLYTYLRQVDDFIDESGARQDECLAYVHQQRAMVRDLYVKGTAGNSLLGRIIAHDRANGHRLKEYISLMMDVFEFDARRKNNGSVSAHELHSYSMNLARAYTHFLVHFAEPRYQRSENDILLAHACHRAHMIRDLMVDYDLGYINIPHEDIDTYELEPNGFATDEMSRWLEKEARRIELLMHRGQRTLCSSRMLSVKIMGLLYCFRYEAIMRRIRAAGYSLRTHYPLTFADIIRLCGKCGHTIIQHLFHCAGL